MIDFEDKNQQILFNQERLKQETERYNEIRSRVGILSVVYTIFSVYSIQLVKYELENPWSSYTLCLFIFLALFTGSIYFTIKLLMPKEIAFIDLPEYFYHKLFNEYKAKGIQEADIKFYVRETYKKQLENSVKLNFEVNNKKSYFHYYAFILALWGIVPYLFCIGIKTIKVPDEVNKIEIVNSKSYYNNDSLLNLKILKIMEQNNKSNKPEPKIDSTLVIIKDPIMIKENQEKPQIKKKD